MLDREVHRRIARAEYLVRDRKPGCGSSAAARLDGLVADHYNLERGSIDDSMNNGIAVERRDHGLYGP
jgi:hypothetical protein